MKKLTLQPDAEAVESPVAVRAPRNGIVASQVDAAHADSARRCVQQVGSARARGEQVGAACADILLNVADAITLG